MVVELRNRFVKGLSVNIPKLENVFSSLSKFEAHGKVCSTAKESPKCDFSFSALDLEKHSLVPKVFKLTKVLEEAALDNFKEGPDEKFSSKCSTDSNVKSVNNCLDCKENETCHLHFM